MPNDSTKPSTGLGTQDIQLGGTSRDRLVGWAGAIAGAIPFGSLVQQLIVDVIPNQRIQRIEYFLKVLSSKVDDCTINQAVNDPKRLDTLEEGMNQATRSLSEDRQRYIAELVARGLTKELTESSRARHFMRILNQIDDSQIVILSSYQQKYRIIGHPDTIEFFTRHRDILGPFSREIGGSFEEHARAANKDAMLAHLSAFGLLEALFSLTGSGQSFKQKLNDYQLTPQGREFLNYIGIS